MRITGENTINASVQQVWDALLDPAVLVRTIPGCERLEETGAHTYAMTVTAGVAAIKGTYDGTCALSELHEPSSLTMRLDGSGAPGTVGATVEVAFGDNGDGTTLLHYEADAVVGGMVGGVGQRMLTSVSKRMSADFFSRVEQAITSPAPPVGRADLGRAASASERVEASASERVETTGPQVFTAPPAPGLDETSFLKGVAVGAGLVLLGVAAGRITRRV